MERTEINHPYMLSVDGKHLVLFSDYKEAKDEYMAVVHKNPKASASLKKMQFKIVNGVKYSIHQILICNVTLKSKYRNNKCN